MAPRKVTYSNKSSHAARSAHARGEREFKKYDTSAIRPKKSRKPYFIIVAVLALIAIALAIGVALSGCAQQNPNKIEEGQQVTVQVPDGSSLSAIADLLYDAGLIDSAASFKSEANAQGAASSLQSGVYTFTGGASQSDLVKALVAGPSANAACLTVAEGATIDQIAQAVEKAYGGAIRADDFVSAAHSASAFAADYPFVADAGNDSLEGFLWPKTYDLIVDATASDVVRQMLEQYRVETASLDYSSAQARGLSSYQVLVLASIVEKEGTADTFDRVAAVFLNRLANPGDPSYGTLGSDATTAYIVGDNLDSYDWSTPDPYNTRVTKGLTPTPICSPSLAALQAVCAPAADFGDYYFFSFWPNDQGGVDYFFDKTYADHQQTIAAHS